MKYNKRNRISQKADRQTNKEHCIPRCPVDFKSYISGWILDHNIVPLNVSKKKKLLANFIVLVNVLNLHNWTIFMVA